MASIPTPIRATLGLLATALDAVQELVEHAPEIPMEAVGNSMQLSMRLQQQYVALLTRGDEFLASLRGAPEEAPPWATFDDPPPAGTDADPTEVDLVEVDLVEVDLVEVDLVEVDLVEVDLVDASVADDGLTDADLTDAGPLGDVLDDLPEAEIQDGPRYGGQGDPLLVAATRSRAAAGPAAKKAAAKKVATAQAPANKAPAKKVPAKKVAAKKVPAKKVPAKTVPAKTVPAKTVPAKTVPAKKVPATKGADGLTTVPVKTATARATKAKKAPAVKAATRGKVAKGAGATSALDSARPILTSPTAPAKRGRPAKKAGSPKVAAAPQLDVSLTAGTPSARHQSAFDLAETPADVGRDEIGPGVLSTAAVTSGDVAEDNTTDGNSIDNHDTIGNIGTDRPISAAK